jgi:CheY-like chemotaxis protein
MYELTLVQNGFRATSAANAEAGLIAALELRPSLIVTDVGPPGRAAVFQMMHALRTERQTRLIPVIAVTGYDLPQRANTPAFERVLLKPVPPDALVDSVRTLLTRSALLRARGMRLHARIPHVLERSQRAIIRSLQLAQEHSWRLRCPHCGALLTHSVSRAASGELIEEYRPCRNGCGLFYYDPERQQLVGLLEP